MWIMIHVYDWVEIVRYGLFMLGRTSREDDFSLCGVSHMASEALQADLHDVEEDKIVLPRHTCRI